MKILFIGDMHVKQADLDDCKALSSLILHAVNREHPDRVVFLGDQNHNHAVVNVFVMEFLQSLFGYLQKWKPTALVGNHDMPGVEGSAAHAMMLYSNCEVVSGSGRVIDDILYMPYQTSNEAFIERCNQTQFAGTVVCHQTFNGSTYENGFYAKDGVDPNLIQQKHVISGHIHAPQEFGKVWYPGSPRWQTLSDANVERAIWLVEFENGVPVKKTPFSTTNVCRKIFHFEYNETCKQLDFADLDKMLKLGTVHIDLKGNPAFVDLWKGKLASYPVRLRTFKEMGDQSTVRESLGIQKAFEAYADSFVAPHGTDTTTLIEMHKERIHGNR